MQNKIKFYTKALKFEREFNWPLIGPVTMQQLMVSLASMFVVTVLLFFVVPAEVAPVGGVLFSISIWFLYGAIKPDGKRIHRFCIDLVKHYFRSKHKNMGENITYTKSKMSKLVRIQE